MNEFHFLRPLWLLALLPAVVLAFGALRGRSARGGAWNALIDPALLEALLAPAARASLRLPLALLLGGWLLAVVTLAGPAWERLPEPVHRRADALVIALDLSTSMNATDVSPSRLERARFKIRDLLAARQDGYTALIAWSGDAHAVTPLSDDSATLDSLLGALDTTIMPEPGSDPVAAVRLAGELVRGAGLERGRVLLVGDALDEAQADKIAPLLRDYGLELSVLAVGTAHGAPVPLADGGFAREPNGSISVPALDLAAMRAATRAAGGRFAELALDDRDLRSLLPGPVESARSRVSEGTRRFDQWLDRAPWLACALLPLAALAFRRGWLLGIALCLLLPQPRAQALEWQDALLTPDQQGARAREAQDPATAAKLFRSPDWRGTAAYEAGDYAGAAEAFAAAKGADADYNRGNALARAGKLQESLAAYDAALGAQPGMEDAAANRKLVEDLLRQQQQQKQQQQKNKDGSESSQDSQQQKGQSSQDQQGQDQDGAQQPPAKDSQSDQDSSQGKQSTPEPGRENGKDKSAAQGVPKPEPQQREPGAAEGNAEPSDKDASGKTQAAAEPRDEARESERSQALEQWLRQVPDDPGALLRRKFEYEARARRAEDGS